MSFSVCREVVKRIPHTPFQGVRQTETSFPGWSVVFCV